MDSAALAGVAIPQQEANESEKQMDQFYQPQGAKRDGASQTLSYSAVGSDKISLAEYRYWAARQRERERNDTADFHSRGLASFAHTVKGKIGKGEKDHDVHVREATDSPTFDDVAADLEGLSERELELVNARRALRVAGWATIFYLITTDILGPFNAPYAIASMGMASGVVLYVVFGIIAFITGVMLHRLFLHMDSVRYPIRTFGDLGGRVFGSWMRHLCSILQAIQLVLNVGLICLSNGQGVAQIAAGGNGPAICFSVAVVIWTILGIIVGQIRSLQGLGLLANSSVWLNILIIILSMAFIAHSPPNYASAAATYGDSIGTGPVVVVARVNQPVFSQVNGLMNMVFAYGGSMIFPELMAEMRRPHDFIRSMALAQALIITCYLVYGIYVYAMQGQYTLPLAYQGVSRYAWQTVTNVIALITGAIAAGLYGNIGLKVIYINIVEGLLKGPPLMTSRGRVVWSGMVVLFWGTAFVIGSAIPSVGTLSGLVAAVCIFQFTYTFPPLFTLGYWISVDAAAGDEEFSTPGVAPRRVDNWTNMSRWSRGIFGGGMKRVLYKLGLFLFFLAALATAALGMWASGTDLREALKKGAATSFGCTAPV
ncbi:RHTO0S18e01222g2_1 [Rhodotorula toruloides]|uniref:RHTO0S18e01222g2_1 n=1 Tax=Rhodotorula toruloides TaxID=5286 RepID=A0A061BN53_RHOTO|nr:RHTO0S18e01222g2_1 [Rhodotorula toruloides]